MAEQKQQSTPCNPNKFHFLLIESHQNTMALERNASGIDVPVSGSAKKDKNGAVTSPPSILFLAASQEGTEAGGGWPNGANVQMFHNGFPAQEFYEDPADGSPSTHRALAWAYLPACTLKNFRFAIKPSLDEETENSGNIKIYVNEVAVIDYDIPVPVINDSGSGIQASILDQEVVIAAGDKVQITVFADIASGDVLQANMTCEVLAVS